MTEAVDATDPTSFRLAGQTVLLVGATGGLGEPLALAAGAAGAQTILAGRQVVKLEKLADRIEAAGGPVPVLYPVDLSGAKAVDYDQMAAAIRRECGGLHTIVHLAAEFSGLTPLAHIGEERWERGLHVGVSARFLVDQACFGLLREAAGRIVHVLDDVDQVGKAYWGSYGVAQHALRGLLATEASEQEGEGVTVVGFVPPPMRTRLRAAAFVSDEVDRAAEPAEQAERLLELLASGRTLIPGHIYGGPAAG